MGKYYVIDLETTVRNKGPESVGKFAAHPQNKHNDIVLYAYKKEGDEKASTFSRHFVPIPPNDMDIMVGHNVAFDIQYLITRSTGWRNWFLSPKSKIWDTMIAEYILTGQADKYASLDYCALKHAGAGTGALDFYTNMKKLQIEAEQAGKAALDTFKTDRALFYATWGHVLKDDKIKDYWEAGYDTTDIPVQELIDYALSDVENTEMIFLSQIELADQQNQIELIQAMMESRMATIEMEYNGFKFNKSGAIEEADDIATKLKELQSHMQTNADKLLPDDVVLDATSGPQLSKLIFGGIHKYKTKEVMLDDDGKQILYKSGKKKGQVRTKIVTKEVRLPQLIHSSEITKTTPLKNGWKLDDAVVDEIIEHLTSPKSSYTTTDSIVLEIAELLKQARALQKDLTAFYRPYIDLTWDDGCIHANFSHTATDTGRLSCSNPNIQQVSGK